jgi:RNA polymerase sigma-32 factor
MQAAPSVPVMSIPVLPVPLSAGSIEAYIQAVRRFPILSAEEEKGLATRFRADGDLDSARQMVLSHLRLVVAVARGYLGYGLPHADLIQEGNIGLMKAVKRFDPQRGVRLVSFALHWIRAEIHEYILRNWRLVRVATTKAQRKLFFNLRSMKPRLAALSSEEVSHVAAELRVKPEEVLEMEGRLAGQEITFDSDDEEDSQSPARYLSDPAPEPSRALEEKQLNQVRSAGLERALGGLDPRSRRIVESRWLREKDAATLHELAAEFKVSAERIRQIEVKALEKMRKLMAQLEESPKSLPSPA